MSYFTIVVNADLVSFRFPSAMICSTLLSPVVSWNSLYFRSASSRSIFNLCSSSSSRFFSVCSFSCSRLALSNCLYSYNNVWRINKLTTYLRLKSYGLRNLFYFLRDFLAVVLKCSSLVAYFFDLLREEWISGFYRRLLHLRSCE